MKKITNFTELSKDEYKKLREAMEAALLKVAEDYGIKIKAGNASHAPGFCDMKFTLSVVSADGSAYTREAFAFEETATLYGFKKTDLGREFSYDGKTMKICGLNSRSKNCIIATDIKGARFGFPPKLVQDLLKVGVNA